MNPRNNLPKQYPRLHYNKLGKTKQSFETEDDAYKYIRKLHLLNYIIYKCTYCSKFHISHQ